MDADEPEVAHPRPRGQRDRGRQRRRALLIAGAEILSEEGREAVTQRAVARRAGASLSAMTYYFADLDDMVSEAGRELIRSRIREVVRAADGAGAEDGPAAARIVAMTLPGTSEAEARVFVENVTRMGQIDRKGEQVDHLIRHVEAAIAAVLRRGHEAVAMPQQLLALVLGSVVLTPRGLDPRVVSAQLVEQFLALDPARPA